MFVPQTAECYKCHISLVAALNTACCSAAVRCYEHNKYHNFHKKVQPQVKSPRNPLPGFCSHLWGTKRQPGNKKSLFVFDRVNFTLIFKGRLSQNMWLGIISSPVAPLSFNTIIPPKKYKRKQMNRTNKIIPNAPIVLLGKGFTFVRRTSLSEIFLFSLNRLLKCFWV